MSSKLDKLLALREQLSKLDDILYHLTHMIDYEVETILNEQETKYDYSNKFDTNCK